ncbi:MAG: molybdenum ABC transporter ATP-binding protein [Saprospiraceae bacterium]|nr:MAG: molybdenum ABC transporter ATP-binding protein [Saprospiraceae bacterium]
MKRTLLQIEQLRIFNQTISARISQGELIAIIGPNRSGKTTLAKVLCRAHSNYEGGITRFIDPSQIAFSDYSANSVKFHYADFYYQQRYDSNAASLQNIKAYLGYDPGDTYAKTLLNLVLSEGVLQKQLIELSSGETRKVLLLKNLLKRAEVYLLDNPFTGLDVQATHNFIQLFHLITTQFGKTILLLLNDNSLNINFSQVIALQKQADRQWDNVIHSSFFNTPSTDFKTVFQINNGDIIAGEKVLINQVNWTIKKGEKWLLRGKNGSGKSTLMSLLNADNPAAYRLGITLFDRRRGSGESIWDIKAKIGFVSPEIQQFWNLSHKVKDIICSGFTGTIYLNRQLDTTELESYKNLIQLFGLKDLENAVLGSLSSGEKRMVMVARALVKNPPVLILDEPFQGLDQSNFHFLHEFLNHCVDENRTVIQITHLDKEVLPGMNHLAVIDQERLKIGIEQQHR